MARRDKSVLRLEAVRVEGALILPDILASAASGTAEGQSPESYGIDRGLNLRDEIGRAYLIAKGLWATFQEGRGAARPDAVHRAFADGVLTKVLGFEFPHRRRFASKAGGDLDLLQAAGRVPVVIAGTEGIDRVEIVATSGADPIRRSATTLIQGELNSREGALWGVATNGPAWRILRDNESITRPGYIEIDLARIFRDDLYSDFTAFWLIAHRSRFPQEGTAGSDCVLEHWRQLGREQGVTARDDLRDGVQKALFHFGRGFLENPANKALVERVNADGTERLTKEDFFRQLLRLVYRLIFVMTAEDREILHSDSVDEAARTAYANGYATGRLRERSRNRIAWDRHHDAYEGVKVVFRALRHGEPKLALPALGGLFAAEQTPDLDAARLANKRFLKGLYNLAWLRRGGALSRINWRDMDTEEFGSVYESLLELIPIVSDGGRTFSFMGEADEDAVDPGAENAVGKKSKTGARGNERKTTGSYYTPDSLVQLLLKEALDPVIDSKVAEHPGEPEALLTLKVIDPACGSGHFVLAAAGKIARRLAELRHAGSPTISQYRHSLRDVARQCLYGVDRNPMAVELTKVALWLETVEPGKPLGFLDANIRCGDALLGLFDLDALRKGIPGEAYKPLTGDDKETAKHFGARNRAEKAGQGALDFGGRGDHRLPAPPPLAEAIRDLRALPEDSVEQVAEKQRRMKAAANDPSLWRWRVAADQYVAAFLTPKTGGVPANHNTVTIPTTAHVWAELSGQPVYGPLIDRAQDVACEARAFHWPLEFPEAFAAGGFDAVLGNPPWERVKLQEQEFFASRDDAIANAPNQAARGRLIAALSSTNAGSRERNLYEEFESAKRLAESASTYARMSGEDGGRFPLTGRGDVNTYALFAELFSQLAGAKGRAGVIVPTGIATDVTTAPFFAAMVDGLRLASLLSFENEELIFPAVHHAYKFCLLVLKPNIQSAPSEFVFFARSAIETLKENRRFTLTPQQIALINPNTKTAPVFRARADAELTARIYSRVPVFVRENQTNKGNPWRAAFYTRIWHMAEDSNWFRTADQLREMGYAREDSDWVIRGSKAYGVVDTSYKPNAGRAHSAEYDRYVPLYEAKMIHQFDHRWATYETENSTFRDGTLSEKTNQSFEPVPRYWVPQQEVISRLADKGWSRGWLMGWRNIARATDERSLIASVFPKVAAGHSLPLCLPEVAGPSAACLLGNMCSLIADYCERQKLGGINLTFQFLFQLPLLAPSTYTASDLAFVTIRILELTYTSHSLAPFASDLGYDGPPFAWNEDRRALLRAELDAFYARAYGLTRDELRYILDPTEVMGPDYPSETFRVLKNNEKARYGEFRTARLVLEAWDRQSDKSDAA
jgi:hypothetical protein